MGITQKKKSILFNKADAFAHKIYKLTRKFPKSELYGLTSQICRAALSVPINIVEGYTRDTAKENIRFLRIAYASLKETEYLIEFSYQEELISNSKWNNIQEDIEELARIIWSTIKTLQNKSRE